jgi:hypothetical protein
MARIRSVHPDICISETMAVVSAELERTFVRLWTHCDDHGRCQDNVHLIKAGIYPLHLDVTPERLDEELDGLVVGVPTPQQAEGQQVPCVPNACSQPFSIVVSERSRTRQ